MAPPTARQRLVATVTALVAAIWLVLDQATKHAAVVALEPTARVIDLGFIDLRVIRNPNAAFSIPAEVIPGLFVIVTIVVIVLVVRALPQTHDLRLATAYGLVSGGALGNCMDRIFRMPGFPSGHVVDFLDLGWFPVFNIADTGIVVGAIGVAGVMTWLDAKERRAATAEGPDRAGAAAKRKGKGSGGGSGEGSGEGGDAAAEQQDEPVEGARVGSGAGGRADRGRT